MDDQLAKHSSSIASGEDDNWKKWLVIAAVLAVPLISVICYGIFRGERKATNGNVTEIDWVVMRELDMNTGRASERLAKIDGKKVRAPGFMVPLEDNRSEVTEYLLVPNPQACIHAPPPPMNQMVYVRMVGSPAKMIYGPVWVEGTLRIAPQTHQYGSAGFQIYGEITEPYKEN